MAAKKRSCNTWGPDWFATFRAEIYLLQFLREKRGKQQVNLLGDALGKYVQSGEAVRKDAESLSDYELRHGALLRHDEGHEGGGGLQHGPV